MNVSNSKPGFLKSLWGLMAVTSAIILIAAGCGDSGPELKGPSDEGLLPEAVAVRKAFESAHPSIKNPVEQVLKLVKAGSVRPEGYAEALPQLQALASDTSLSAEQKQALESLIERLKSELAGPRRTGN